MEFAVPRRNAEGTFGPRLRGTMAIAKTIGLR